MQRAMIVFCLFLSLARNAASAGPENQAQWQQAFNDRLPAYGHRNWIVIADSAYPAQSREGIETIVSGADHLQVLEYVLNALSSAKHVRPIVFTDRELNYIPETDAPGITAYRNELGLILKSRNMETLPHEQLISKLDSTAQTFRVLIIKTNMTLPYTSVFLQLDCAYWTSQAEQKLRASMAKH